MNMDFLNELMIPTIVAICLCIGYIIKSWKKVPNKWIPTILAVIGVVTGLWINAWIPSPDVILKGLVSGLGSCGLYDTYKHFFTGGEKDD